jgi:glycosyltransferase involved in cell wall biosynthesis
MPSLIENFPYAVCEQMGFGKICLVSHSGGHAEIVEDGVSGFIYRNEDEFEAKLNRILSLSAEERSQMSQAARQRIQTLCDYNSFYKRKEQFLTSLLVYT